MGKRIKTLICALAICLVAFSVPVYAEGKELSLVLPLEAGQGFTSLKFSVQVNNVSEDAKVSVDFSKSLPEKTIAKTTYNKGILTVYLAGGDELFPQSSLEIGELTVENDENKGENLFVELLPETVEIVNSGYNVVDDVDAVRDEIKLTGSGAEKPEEENPEEPEEPEAEKADFEELKKLLEELKGLNAQDYTQESWNTLSALMEKAAELLESKTATTEQVKDMVSQLKEAKEKLQVDTPDSDNTEQAKQELQGVLDELDKLLSSDYTAESWNQLYVLMEEARGLIEKGASKEEYDAMTAKLRETSGKLVKTEPEFEKTSDDEDSQKNLISGEAIESKNKIKNVLTGDNSPIAALALAGVGSIAIVVTLFYKKMQKK